MKIHSSLVRQLREQRAWSQEHLAEIAGLSLRTVQRVEADGGASAETRMALAAAFGIDVAALNAPVNAPAEGPARAASAPEDASPAGVAAVAPSSDKQLLTFEQYRALRLAVVLVLLLAVDVFRNGAITWSRWPLVVGAVWLALRLFRNKWVQPRVRTR